MQLLQKRGSGSSHGSGSDSPKSGSANDVSTDGDVCTVVIDEDGKAVAVKQGGPTPNASSSSTPQLGGAAPGAATATAAAAAAARGAPKDVDVALPAPQAVPAAGSSRPRTFYVDWLRAFLTVLVVVHHCVVAYQSTYAWGAKRGDTALLLLSELFVNGNQAYFMTLFFFLSGLYVPGSYRRKGAGHFLWDRTLRLVVPCIVYSFLGPPFILWWNQMAKTPGADPGPVLLAQFRAWLKPGWPSTYILPTGPPWFVWMLWCFNVAYVILKWMAACEWLALPILCCGGARSSSSSSSQQSLPSRAQRRPAAFTTRQMLLGAAGLTAALFSVCYGTRMLNHFVFKLRPYAFVQRGPFVSFMPDLFPVYVLAFALGIYGGPSGWDLLSRLPDAWGSWCLCAGGCWWLWAGWLLNIVLRPQLGLAKGLLPFVLTWAMRTFVEQSFCVVWSIGLLVVFRLAFNAKPGLAGRHIIAGAYGAYLVHPLVLILFARVIMTYPFPSAVVNAAIISPPSVVTSWMLAIVLRMLPGAHHIL